jgi:hypothetical protein
LPKSGKTRVLAPFSGLLAFVRSARAHKWILGEMSACLCPETGLQSRWSRAQEISNYLAALPISIIYRFQLSHTQNCGFVPDVRGFRTMFFLGRNY